MKPTAAARRAGYADPRNKSWELENKDEYVKKEIAGMQEKTRAKAMYTREQAVQDLIDGVALSKAKGDPMALARCVNELNKMHGWLAAEKKEFTHALGHNPKAPNLRLMENMDESVLLEKIGGEAGMTIDIEAEPVGE